MSKEYLDRNNVGKAIDNLIKDQAVTSDGDRVYLDEVEWYMFIQEICKLKPKNQIILVEGRFIIDSGKEFGISQRACYIKLSPRKLIGIGALGRRLEEKGVEGKKVLIILESEE